MRTCLLQIMDAASGVEIRHSVCVCVCVCVCVFVCVQTTQDSDM